MVALPASSSTLHLAGLFKGGQSKLCCYLEDIVARLLVSCTLHFTFKNAHTDKFQSRHALAGRRNCC